MLPNNSVSFITNNIKGMQSSKNRLKLMQYFKDKIGSTGVLFLQEAHYNSKVKLIEFKETYDLCDIWRIRNTKSKRFTFTQKHSSGFIQRRLD